MPLLIHGTVAQFSLLSNWHCASKLHPYLSQSFGDLSSWMLKGSILTSILNFKRIPFPQNTSIINQSIGPSILMVYYKHLRCIYILNLDNLQLCVLQNSHDHPLSGHFSQMRHHTRSKCTIIVRTSCLHQGLLQIIYHLFPHQTCVPQALWATQATFNSQEALEFNFHGFHREASSIIQLYLNSSHC